MPSLRFFVPSNRTDKNGKPAPLDGLNELVNSERYGYRVGNSMKRANGRNAERSCMAAMRDSGWECPKCKCLVRLTFVETSRRRDPDNIFGGAKFILDGITKRRGLRSYGAGAIEDDSQKWIRLEYDSEILIDKGNPGCWVEITTMEE